MHKEQKNKDQWEYPTDVEPEEEEVKDSMLCMAILLLIALLLAVPAAVLWSFINTG